jgi:NADPH-dependent 2,4-dienoyl-CoA reductase/sulfur reductase-like enzyme
MKVRYDVIVAGAGPAGIAASVRAREAGARVLVIDDNPTKGGQIWRGGDRDRHGRQATRWFEAFRTLSIPVVSGACIVSADAGTGTVVAETADGPREFAFDKLVIATGARELFLPFPGWTLPNVVGVGGLQALATSGLPVAGKRIVVAGSGPLLIAAAAYLRKRGGYVRVIAEQASMAALARFGFRLPAAPAKLLQAVRLRAALAGIPYRASCWVEAAEGDGRVERVRLRCGERTRVEACDYAAVSYGLFPNTELAALVGCECDSAGITVDDMQRTTVAGVLSAGECTGIGGVDLSLVEGEIAGCAAAGATERARRLFPSRERGRRFAAYLNTAFALRGEVKRLSVSDTIVCRCEDVPFERLQRYTSFRAAKLHTRCGMGPCQGRVCGAAAHALFGWTSASVRPPVFPASVAALAMEDSSISQEAAVSE